MKWLEEYGDHAYALMRIMAGFMFSFHGAQKVLGLLSEFQPPAGSQLWFGGLIELLGGLAVMLGFLVRGTINQHSYVRLESGALYWHLVDVIWIFLFPLFYLLH